LSDTPGRLAIAPATIDEVPLILTFIKELATYEREPDAVVATEAGLRQQLFGERPAAEVLIARWNGEPVGFALFFHNFSTWVGRRGLYLEDLFVRPAQRGLGIGKALLVELARIARARGCGRMEWAVLDWNEPAIGFYKGLGAVPMTEWTVFRLAGEALERLALSSSKKE
jgi:GNAT superfamily N-acetyltransferase